jgi:ABC-type multidrug transport system ATPase subunit
MGSDFDAKRYYTAVTITKLNEDVLLALGSDELPIETMDLTQQQRERIVLARAIYSDRDVYLFDEPFKSAVFSSNVLLLFADVIHQILASDPGKAIIICSSNSQILQMCSKIYDTTENKVFTRLDYERFSAASYHEGAVHYTFENIKGSNPNALTVYKKQSRFHVEIVNENPITQDESTEHLISKQKKETNNNIGIFNLSLISLMTFTNCSIYILLTLGFIFVVMSSYIEPWLEFVFLAGFVFAGKLKF